MGFHFPGCRKPSSKGNLPKVDIFCETLFGAAREGSNRAPHLHLFIVKCLQLKITLLQWGCVLDFFIHVSKFNELPSGHQNPSVWSKEPTSPEWVFLSGSASSRPSSRVLSSNQPCLCHCLNFHVSQVISWWVSEWVSEWVKSFSHVRLFATPWTVAYQAPPSMGFSRHECWSGLPFPAPGDLPDPGIEPGSPALHLLVAPHLSVFWHVCLWSVSPPEFKLGGSAHALKQPWPHVSSPVYFVAVFPHFTAPRHSHRLTPVIAPQIHPAFKKNACKS